MATHVCPWWIGYLLASPVRKLFQSPQEILRPYLEPGMTTVDLGCGMGFFSIPMAQLVGPAGRVVCVDLQPRMLSSLERRAAKAGVSEQVHSHRCSAESLGLEELSHQVSFALAFAMVHEVPEQERFFQELHHLLRPTGRLLVAEPRGHVTAEAFEESVRVATAAGFVELDRPSIRKSHAMVLQKR